MTRRKRIFFQPIDNWDSPLNIKKTETEACESFQGQTSSPPPPSSWQWELESFSILLRHAFLEELNQNKDFLSEDEILLVLGTSTYDYPYNAAYKGDTNVSPVGYPKQPYCFKIASTMWKWANNRKCPVFNNKSFYGFDEEPYINNRIAVLLNVHPYVVGMESLWNHWNNLEIVFRFRKILKLLGRRGILDLLGMRKTIGTENIFPPIRCVLEGSFNAPHSSASNLSVGARALSKHFHRDQMSSWWGNCTGTEEDKNKHAQTVMKKILDDANWMNVHMLSPDMILIIEIRQFDGYGARWTIDGKSFRGFLEPMFEGGHDAGWKH